MKKIDRRKFIESVAGGAAAIAALPRKAFGLTGSGGDSNPVERRSEGRRNTPPRIKFAAIGLNHGHINGQVEAVLRGGGELISFYAKEPDQIGRASCRERV